MAELKTKENDKSPEEFIRSVENPKRVEDGLKLLEIFKEITGEKAKMWGTSIIGFGGYDYVYASGRTGTWLSTGFSPRKANMTLYIMDYVGNYNELLGKLGKHKTGKSCLYIKNLEDADLDVLRELIKKSFENLNGKTIRS